MIGIVPWFFIEREWCRSIGYIQYGGIGKLLEGGGVEAWKVEVLRQRVECLLLIDLEDVYKNDIKMN